MKNIIYEYGLTMIAILSALMLFGQIRGPFFSATGQLCRMASYSFGPAVRTEQLGTFLLPEAE